MSHQVIIAGHPLTFPLTFGLAAIVVISMYFAASYRSTCNRERIGSLLLGLLGGLLMLVPLIVLDLNYDRHGYPRSIEVVKDYLVFILALAFLLGSVATIYIYRRLIAFRSLRR